MSTLKVNTIEKFNGSSGVTIKDTVNIAPDSGVKNLVVSGNTTVETNLTVNGATDFDGHVTMDSTNISGANQISCASIQVSGAATAGSLVVGGTTLLNPWKCMGSVTLTESSAQITFSDRVAEFNVDTYAYDYEGVFNNVKRFRIDVHFDTDLTNDNYIVLFRSEGDESGHFRLRNKYTWGFRLGLTMNSNVYGTSLDYMVISP